MGGFFGICQRCCLCNTVKYSQPFEINWMTKIAADRFRPEQKTLVLECSKNLWASRHCPWRESGRSYFSPVLLPVHICKVHSLPNMVPVRFGHTISKGKKQHKSSWKLLLPFGKLKGFTVYCYQTGKQEATVNSIGFSLIKNSWTETLRWKSTRAWSSPEVPMRQKGDFNMPWNKQL